MGGGGVAVAPPPGSATAKALLEYTLPCHKYCNMRNNECIFSCRVVRVMMFLQSNHCKMVN